MVQRVVSGLVALALVAGSAVADSTPAGVDLAKYADPLSVVLAVRAHFGAPGGAVRLAVYDER
ncbi:MAG: hypothetical protein AB7P23_03220, partial [Amphiplicatus sp.]